MSATKRKHNAAGKESSNTTKRRRTSSSNEDAAAPVPETKTTKSILSKDQTAFPRGGAGPLTLIEQKQIRAKATRDATREAAAGSRDLFSANDHAASDSDDSGMDIDEEVQSKKSGSKKSKKSKSSSSKSDQSSVPIQSISFKSLTDDSLLLARITNISTRGLTVALPNNLTGFVPLTSISKQFSSRIAKSLQNESDKEESDEDEDLDLREMFAIGQALRVAVRKNTEDESSKKQNNNRIDLSIEPHTVNKGLSKSNVVPGITVQASVVSVEDHGVILDVGFDDNSSAFCPKKLIPGNANLKEGAVVLCTVTKAVGKAIHLSANTESTIVAKSASSIDAYLPGTLAEVLLTEVEDDGFAGKILGLLDATADSLHSAASLDSEAFKGKYSIGQKIKARIIANFAQADHKRVAVSLLDTAVDLKPAHSTTFALSAVIDRAQVIAVNHGLGCYFSLPGAAYGFCHISRLKDNGTVDSLGAYTGPFKIGTEHQARVLDFNSIDGLYTLTLQKSVIEQPFLRLEDIKNGQIVSGTIEKVLIGESGVRGILLKLAAGIIGIVSTIHLSDAELKHPERKFREGAEVKARVLSVDVSRRRLDLTLKKSLVKSDQPAWSDWNSIIIGSSTIGTLIKVESLWAIVQFFGNVKGRLPVSEMSEAYIKDAKDHYKVGQVLAVSALKVDPEEEKLLLTARENNGADRDQTKSMLPGTLVTASIYEKSADDIKLRLEPSQIIGRLSLDHVQDGSEKKRKSALEKLRVGQKLQDLLVLEVKGRSVVLSNKASLRKAAEDGTLLTSYADLKEDAVVTGYVANITEHRVFVRFAQGITGVINEAQIPDEWASQEQFNMKALQPISAKVVQIDYKGATPRFWLSMKTNSDSSKPTSTAPVDVQIDGIDSQISSLADLSLGSVTKARITSVKDTQLNVQLGKDVQGRVDVSEVFDDITDIPDRRSPLKHFARNQVIDVKILGQHDSRSYKFLPLSHRKSKNTVFELSTKPATVSGKNAGVIKLEDMKVGDKHIAFVNNVSDNALMVNISPAVRGRIAIRNLTNDFSVLANLGRNFPVGCAIESEVIAIDLEKNRLDLSTKMDDNVKALTMDSITVGDIVAGKVTKTTERSVIVQLSDDLVAVVDLIDIADNYDLADPTRFGKGEIVRAYVLRVDAPNRKINLSLRPSKILSSGIDAEDPELTIHNLNVGDIRRGFVHNVSAKGVFVNLAHGLTAFVRVTNLSDAYLKEWQDQFQRGQLVKGKITLVDRDSGHIQMSLRQSHVDGSYQPLTTIKDLQIGQVVEATIAKVETFGVFIVVNNSENVRGLCHRSQIADQRIEDVTKVGFSAGDKVKAKVLKVEVEQKRINFGMKASYFADGSDDDMSTDNESDVEDSDAISGLDDDSDAGVEIADVEMSEAEESEEEDADNAPTAQALTTGGFDWFGAPTTEDKLENTAVEEKSSKPKKSKKKSIIEDRTGDLDRDGPQSTDDFERLLLSQPDNAAIWIQFMAFHVDLGDIDTARSVASKALSSIGLANETAKKSIWIALFNVENEFGDEEGLQSTLERACQVMDAEDMHTSLASIYIRSGKLDKADDLFQTILKKFTQNPRTWLNYATFLFDNLEEPVRARALLPRALQALPAFTHFDITKQFAQLEFKTKTGVPEEGRTRFQGLINLYPKRIDLFNIMIDHEIKLGDAEQVRSVFEQVLSKDLKPGKVKPFFKRWLEFERSIGEDKRADEVQSRAAKWVSKYNATKEAAAAS